MRIAVTGPQNTGKSTFITDLQERYPNFKSPSRTYRDVIREKGLVVNQQTTTDTQAIIRDFMVDQLQEDEGDVIYDRCLIDNYVYTLWMTRNSDRYDDTLLYETRLMLMHHVLKYDCILFIPFDNTIPLKMREERDIDPKYIRDINAMFIETIIEYKLPNVVTIYGDRDKRIQQASASIEVDKLCNLG